MSVVLQCPLTVCSLAKWRISEHKCSVLHKSLIEELPLNLALNPPFCQTAVMHRFYCHSNGFQFSSRCSSFVGCLTFLIISFSQAPNLIKFCCPCLSETRFAPPS